MCVFILIQLAVTMTKPNQKKLNKCQDQGRVLYLTLHDHEAEMRQGGGLMVGPMVGGGSLRRWVDADGQQSRRKHSLSHSMHKLTRGYFGASQDLLWGFWWLPMVVEVLGGAEVSRQWLVAEKWLEKSPEKLWQQGKKIAAGWSGRGFGAIFRSLVGSIKTIHKLVFVVYIARFQLTQKSSNLMKFWLSKKALKLH